MNAVCAQAQVSPGRMEETVDISMDSPEGEQH